MPKMRNQPGVRNVDIAISGQGRLQAAYEFSDLDSFKAYMASDYYEVMKADFTTQPFFDGSKEVSEFVGIKQCNI